MITSANTDLGAHRQKEYFEEGMTKKKKTHEVLGDMEEINW